MTKFKYLLFLSILFFSCNAKNEYIGKWESVDNDMDFLLIINKDHSVQLEYKIFEMYVSSNEDTNDNRNQNENIISRKGKIDFKRKEFVFDSDNNAYTPKMTMPIFYFDGKSLELILKEYSTVIIFKKVK